MSQKYHLETILGIWNCQICNFVADGTHPNVLMSHLFDKHNIKRKDGGFQEYLNKYFKPPVCCCGCGRSVKLHRREFGYSLFAPGCKGLNRSRNPSCIDFYLHLDLSVDEAIIVFRDHKSRTAKKYSTDELRKRLSEINSGAKNPASYKSIQKRSGKIKKEIRQDLKEKSGGKNNGFYGRGHTDETKRKCAEIRSKQSKFVSKPELVVWGMLHALDIEFDHEFLIDKFCVDFSIKPNIIIEVYGDYWHSDKMKSYGVIVDKPAKDKIKNDFLRSLGYKVHVFWESEIMKTPKNTFYKLKKIVNENKIHQEN